MSGTSPWVWSETLPGCWLEHLYRNSACDLSFLLAWWPKNFITTTLGVWIIHQEDSDLLILILVLSVLTGWLSVGFWVKPQLHLIGKDASHGIWAPTQPRGLRVSRILYYRIEQICMWKRPQLVQNLSFITCICQDPSSQQSGIAIGHTWRSLGTVWHVDSSGTQNLRFYWKKDNSSTRGNKALFRAHPSDVQRTQKPGFLSFFFWLVCILSGLLTSLPYMSPGKSHEIWMFYTAPCIQILYKWCGFGWDWGFCFY